MAENQAKTPKISEKISRENLILFDWFSMTSKIDSVDDIKRLIGLDDPAIKWLELPGINFYNNRIFFAGISICWGMHAKSLDYTDCQDTVFLNISGSGCRAFETYSSHKDWSLLFSLILADPDKRDYHLTRLDVAYDDWVGLLDVWQLKTESERSNIVTPFRTRPVNYDTANIADICQYYGSKTSDVMFRCYNKKEERGRTDIDHWVRFEMQLRDDSAFSFLSQLHHSGHIGKTFFGVLNHYIRYVRPSKSDTNKSRWATRTWWLKFCNTFDNIPLWSRKDTDYNFYKLKRFVIDHCGNAIDTYIRIKGIEDFQFDLKHKRSKLSRKYLSLINQCESAEKIIEESTSIEDALKRIDEEGISI